MPAVPWILHKRRRYHKRRSASLSRTRLPSNHVSCILTHGRLNTEEESGIPEWTSLLATVGRATVAGRRPNTSDQRSVVRVRAVAG